MQLEKRAVRTGESTGRRGHARVTPCSSGEQLLRRRHRLRIVTRHSGELGELGAFLPLKIASGARQHAPGAFLIFWTASAAVNARTLLRRTGAESVPPFRRKLRRTNGETANKAPVISLVLTMPHSALYARLLFWRGDNDAACLVPTRGCKHERSSQLRI